MAPAREPVRGVVGLLRDRRLDAAPTQVAPVRPGRVGLVRPDPVRRGPRSTKAARPGDPHPVQHDLELRTVAELARRDDDRHQLLPLLGRGMDLRRPPATRTTQPVVGRLNPHASRRLLLLTTGSTKSRLTARLDMRRRASGAKATSAQDHRPYLCHADRIMAVHATLWRMEPDPVHLAGQLRRGVIEPCVLAVIAQQPTYGLDLARTLSERGLLESEGTLYPLLSRLRKRNLVTTAWEESPSGPPRRYYRITPAGRSGLATFTREWSQFRDAVDLVIGDHA